MTELTIAHHLFTVPVRYGEGSVLNQKEGAELDRAWRNKFRIHIQAEVKKMLEAGKSVDEVQLVIDERAEVYELGARKSNGGRPVQDPFVMDAIRDAAADLMNEAVKQGKRRGDIDKREINKLARKLVKKFPRYVEAAKQRAEQTSAFAQRDLRNMISDL